MEIFFPYQITEAGRTAVSDAEEHVRQMIQQVLFTSPGERVNRPTFGSGLQELVFAPGSDEMASAVEATVQSALLEWLGDVVRAESVSVEFAESTLTVTVRYVWLQNQERRVETFERRLATL
jgi:phage baseplate assembly protein W